MKYFYLGFLSHLFYKDVLPTHSPAFSNFAPSVVPVLFAALFFFLLNR